MRNFSPLHSFSVRCVGRDESGRLQATVESPSFAAGQAGRERGAKSLLPGANRDPCMNINCHSDIKAGAVLEHQGQALAR